jgi:hypothetical protein
LNTTANANKEAPMNQSPPVVLSDLVSVPATRVNLPDEREPGDVADDAAGDCDLSDARLAGGVA